ncbi:hypothetical protein EYD10_18167 [Varanus komodoensis]|nr:hypothetical protein EYD10_18167 [Varanus komodoensis]
MQSWVRDRQPETCAQAVALAEDFLRRQPETEKPEEKVRLEALQMLWAWMSSNIPDSLVYANGSWWPSKTSGYNTGVERMSLAVDHVGPFTDPENKEKTSTVLLFSHSWKISSPFQVPVPVVEMAVEASEAGQVLLVNSWNGRLCREATEEQDQEARSPSDGQAWEHQMNPAPQPGAEQAELNGTSLGRDGAQYCKTEVTFKSQQELGIEQEKTHEKGIFCMEDDQVGRKYTGQPRAWYGEAQNTSSSPGRDFGQSSDLGKHPIMYTGEKTYLSSYCGSSFFQAPEHPGKERSHAGLRNTCKCSHCGKSFSCGSSFKEHLRIHTGEAPYQCSHCGKNTGRCSILREHIRTHPGEKPYTCSECVRSFNRKRYLTVHERMHRGENPYKCVHCGKSFPKRSKLVIHERIHTGENPFVCSECGKGFNQKGNLMTHMRLHTGEKPYKCSHCGKRFSQKAGLSAHEKTHAGRKRTI